MDRNAVGILFVVFLGLTFRDLFLRGSHGSESQEHEHDFSGVKAKKEIPETHFKHVLTGPTLKIFYCVSCGYKKAFEEYSQILRDKFPEIVVHGDNFPPAALKLRLAQFLGIAKMVIIGLIIGNVNVFTHMNMETPGFWLWMNNHKIYGCMMTFFLSNTIEGNLMSTGAFEIFYNDVPIWSKIETGRIPSPAELFQIIDNQNSMKADLNSFKF